jgi:hypothetical protein
MTQEIQNTSRFDFTDMIDEDVDGYIFENDVQKQIFIAKVKSYLEHDQYMWDHIVQSVMLLTSQVAEEMDIPSEE